jgi:hypothetical protein
VKNRGPGITVSLSGGLGNQLFQLAAAISLSDTLGCGVGIFVEPNLPGNTPREFELQSLLGSGVEIVSSKQVSIWHEEQWGYDDRFWQIERGTHLVGVFNPGAMRCLLRPELGKAYSGVTVSAEVLKALKGKKYLPATPGVSTTEIKKRMSSGQ